MKAKESEKVQHIFETILKEDSEVDEATRFSYSVLRGYLSQNSKFAKIINAIYRKNMEPICAEDLYDVDPGLGLVKDIYKVWYNKDHLEVVGLIMQPDIDYTVLGRNWFREQMWKIIVENQLEVSGNGAKYLKENQGRSIPINVCLYYFGEEKWDGPKRIDIRLKEVSYMSQKEFEQLKKSLS